MRTPKDPLAPKKKRPFVAKVYKQDPRGPGTRAQWVAAFHQRMGLDAARAAVGSDSPEGILGVAVGAAWDVIKKAYRKLVRLHHPDVGGDPAAFLKVQGAFEVLEDDYTVKGRFK